MIKAKKSEVHLRAKRLIDACANEARKQSLLCNKRKLIRAQYEKGLLLLKEDFLRLPHMPKYEQIEMADWPVDSFFPKSIMPIGSDKSMPIFISDPLKEPEKVSAIELSGKDKLRQVIFEIGQVYALQFKIMDNLLSILKSELRKT